jgi:Fe-S cluster assembly protein SufD
LTDYNEIKSVAQEQYAKMPDEANLLYIRNHVLMQVQQELTRDGGAEDETRHFRSAYDSLSKELELIESRRFDAVIGSADKVISAAGHIGVIPVEELPDAIIKSKLHDNYEDKFVAMIHAYSKYAVVIDVPDNAKMNINLLFINTDAPLITQVLTRVGNNSKLGLTEIFQSKTTGSSVLGAMNEVSVADSSSVEVNMLHNEDKDTKVLNFCKGRAGSSSKLNVNFVYNGGSLTRSKNSVKAIGSQSQVDVRELIFGEGDQKFDVNTVIENDGIETNSILESKAAVKGRSIAWLKGFAKIDYGSVGAKSFVSERGLIVDRGAKIESLPSMAIDESEVRATHSSATAPIDEDSLFYIGSRGITEAMARRLMLTGFFADTLYKVNDRLIKVIALALIREKISGRGFGHVPRIDNDDIVFAGFAGKEEEAQLGQHYKYRTQK